MHGHLQIQACMGNGFNRMADSKKKKKEKKSAHLLRVYFVTHAIISNTFFWDLD